MTKHPPDPIGPHLAQSDPTTEVDPAGRADRLPKFKNVLPTFGVPFHLVVQFCCRTTKFDVVTHMCKWLVPRSQSGLTSRGRVPSAPQIWGYLLLMHTPFIAELPNLMW